MAAGRVLVVGGGIAGFALLRACVRAGVDAHLVERMAEPPAAGLGLNLPGNGVRALAGLGVDAHAVPGVPVRRREYRTARGRLLFAVDEAGFWADGPGSVCVRRGDLLDRLQADLPPERVRRGVEVSALTSTGTSARVRFTDHPAEGFDLVVGADGVRSAVRKSTLGGATRASLQSAASWRFVTANPGVDCWVVWSGPQGTLLLIPVDHDRVYGYASATRGGPVQANPQWLTAAFAAFPAPARQAVASALADRSSLYHSPVEEVRIPRWHDGRVVLVGDAAHATAPVWAQGAALAAEDALVLAHLLATHDDWATVGAAYEVARRPRVEHVQAMTDRLSKAAGLPTWLRSVLLPMIGPRSFRQTYEPLRQPVVD